MWIKQRITTVMRAHIILFVLAAFVALNVIFLAPLVRTEGLSDIFGAVIPPGAQPGDYAGQGAVTAVPTLSGTITPQQSGTPPAGTLTPTPEGNYTPIVVSGLTYYPQCSSPAIPGAYWSGQTMPGCATYCEYGCAIASSAMIFSSLSGQTKDPKQFMDLYTQSGSPNCLLSYTRMTSLFNAHNIDTSPFLVVPTNLTIELTSVQGSSYIDPFLQTGQTLLVGGTINTYTHWVWIVGKENGQYMVMDPYWSAPSSGTGADFPVIPYTSNRYQSFIIRSFLPVKARI
ncbi:hypothetical protein KBB12_01680 [Candidatus Woesebacteria bacterium]|nr:hypothetical protein [Candidatus Woesebacteria bacterium]